MRDARTEDRLGGEGQSKSEQDSNYCTFHIHCI